MRSGRVAGCPSWRGQQAVRRFSLADLRGPAALLIDHYDLTQPEQFSHTGNAAEATGDLTKAFVAAQALTIAGGTTNINKNVVAERILGLPRDHDRG